MKMTERPDTYTCVFLSKIGIVPEPKSRCIHNIRGDRRDAKVDSDESAMARQMPPPDPTSQISSKSADEDRIGT